MAEGSPRPAPRPAAPRPPARARPLEPARPAPPRTPDGRYLVIRGRLWRTTNPAIAPQERRRLVLELSRARRDVGRALRTGDAVLEHDARARVDAAKRELGERGAPWWTDGEPDRNRMLIRGTPYAAWYAEAGEALDRAATPPG